MFVCKVCIKDYEGPAVYLAVQTARMSSGKCEICRSAAAKDCYDIPSSADWRLKPPSRRASAKMPKKTTKTQVCFRIPIDTLDAVREEANKRGMPMAEVLRSVWELRCWLKKLQPNQRFAIVEVKTTPKGQINRQVRVIEFVDIKKATAKLARVRRKKAELEADLEAQGLLNA